MAYRTVGLHVQQPSFKTPLRPECCAVINARVIPACKSAGAREVHRAVHWGDVGQPGDDVPVADHAISRAASPPVRESRRCVCTDGALCQSSSPPGAVFTGEQAGPREAVLSDSAGRRRHASQQRDGSWWTSLHPRRRTIADLDTKRSL